MKHLVAKLLWTQDKLQENARQVSQIGTIWNMADVGTNALPQGRMKRLMFEIGMVGQEGNPVGQDKASETRQRTAVHGEVSRPVKTTLRNAVFLGLGPEAVNGQTCSSGDDSGPALVQQELDCLKREVQWMRFPAGIATLMMTCALRFGGFGGISLLNLMARVTLGLMETFSVRSCAGHKT